MSAPPCRPTRQAIHDGPVRATARASAPDSLEKFAAEPLAEPTVRGLVAAGDAENDDERPVLNHGVDNPQATESDAPEVGSAKLSCARWPRLPGKRQDRPSEAGGVGSGQSVDISLRGRRVVDPKARSRRDTRLAQGRFGPYCARSSAAMCSK